MNPEKNINPNEEIEREEQAIGEPIVLEKGETIVFFEKEDEKKYLSVAEMTPDEQSDIWDERDGVAE